MSEAPPPKKTQVASRYTSFADTARKRPLRAPMELACGATVAALPQDRNGIGLEPSHVFRTFRL
jgi:hypothetical protein